MGWLPSARWRRLRAIHGMASKLIHSCISSACMGVGRGEQEIPHPGDPKGVKTKGYGSIRHQNEGQVPCWGMKGRRWIILSETSRKGLFGKQESKTCWGAGSPDGRTTGVVSGVKSSSVRNYRALGHSRRSPSTQTG